MVNRKSLNESTLLRTFSIPVVIFCLLVYICSVTPAAGAEKEAIPSYGQGPREVLIFSDYFCPPCQALEPKL